ncbi:hypothetical protein [Cohaesibacter haloalkalitolerans]|uniref:hypothetical protein n=1 Tax=Cohaesibacter haloalkalitolerans TaxID=1162980 RepID=UPI0013C41CE7|nr:hypothetical protein [Cohaesibacter haloalkalitolerans]
MYIMLGVFVTLLLMLLIVPMIWRRVVRLTRKRMMAEMPMSYSELQAEKDQVRAEMAIDLRKQEVIANRRQDELANKTIRIDRLNKTIEARDAQIANHLETIDGLTRSLASQKDETGRVSGLLQTSEQQLADARQTISDLEETRDQLEKDIYYLETNIDEQKVELAAQMARIENLREEISSLTMQLSEQTGERGKTETLLGQKNTELDRTRERLSALEEKADTLQGQLADKDSEIANLSRQLERATKQNLATGDNSNTLLAEAETRRLEAEAKIASLAMQLETQQKLENGENLSSMIEGLEKEKRELQSTLDKANANNDDLASQLSALEARLQEQEAQNEKDAQGDEATEGNDDSGKTTALTPHEQMLRDEMKLIATRLTEFSDLGNGNSDEAIDGPTTGSPVNAPANSPENGTGPAPAIRASQVSEAVKQSVASAPKDTTQEATNGSEGQPEKAAAAASEDPWSQVFSLADRVRELEKSSR